MISTSDCVTTLIFIFIHRISSEINVALNKRGQYCNSIDLSNQLFDGVRSTSSVQQIQTRCPDFSYLEVNLGAGYLINYVVLYESETAIYRQLSFFKAILKVDDIEEPCSEYMKERRASSRALPMRVNCQYSLRKFDTVRIESRWNSGFDLTEIEIYSFAGELGERRIWYRGCYRNVTTFGMDVPEPVLSNCRNYCISGTIWLMGIMNNSFCICHVYYDTDLLSDVQCDIRCSDGIHYCGGLNTHSVYLVRPLLPVYSGCYTVRSFDDEFIPITTTNMTVDFCIHICALFEQALIKNGSECYCSNMIDGPRLHNYTFCGINCLGEPDSLCGGPSQHYTSYYTCFVGGALKTKCSDVVRCNGLIDMYGECNGTCQAGFVGKHCLERIDRRIRLTTTSTTTTITTTTSHTITITTTTTTTTTITTTRNIFITNHSITNDVIVISSVAEPPTRKNKYQRLYYNLFIISFAFLSVTLLAWFVCTSVPIKKIKNFLSPPSSELPTLGSPGTLLHYKERPSLVTFRTPKASKSGISFRSII